MPIFVCDECNAIENTACGHYWCAFSSTEWFKDPSKDRMKLCSECAPAEFKDGSKTGLGKWHGRFPKEIATPERIAQIGLDAFAYIPPRLRELAASRISVPRETSG